MAETNIGRADASQLAELLAAARSFLADFLREEDSVSLATASKRLEVGTDWLRSHLAEFPNAWRLPAGSTRLAGESRNVGELRIPVGDLRAFEARQRVRKEPA